jgi:hypothetical protein
MEFTPGSRPDGPDCEDRAAWGVASNLNQYIQKIHILSEDDYPDEACTPYYYSRATIDNFNITENLDVGGDVDIDGDIDTVTNITATGTIIANAFGGTAWTNLLGDVSSKKGFDIPHPTKENSRLRYICIEGPTADVYIRGRVKNAKEIELPNYWKGLVDIDSITVSLTPVGAHQSVIVKRWDEDKIYLQSNGGMPIDCFYHVYAERIDVSKNIPEYDGLTTADYPGDNGEYRLNNN